MNLLLIVTELTMEMIFTFYFDGMVSCLSCCSCGGTQLNQAVEVGSKAMKVEERKLSCSIVYLAICEVVV